MGNENIMVTQRTVCGDVEQEETVCMDSIPDSQAERETTLEFIKNIFDILDQPHKEVIK